MLFKSFSANNIKRYAMVPVFDKGEGLYSVSVQKMSQTVSVCRAETHF
jgi:hypothetical protein